MVITKDILNNSHLIIGTNFSIQSIQYIRKKP